jgi:Protein of unknown function (DUF2587)
VIEVPSVADQPGGSALPGPAPRIVVDVGPATGTAPAYRVESPDLLLRLWGLLNAAREELRPQDLPPQSLARVQDLLTTVEADLERAVSPALAAELRHVLGTRPPSTDVASVRIEYAALLGWLGGLVIEMFSQLEAEAQAHQVTARSSGPARR